MSFKRVVVKISTSLLTKDDFSLDIQFIGSIVEQISQLKQKGYELIIVSSGAMAAGRSVLKLQKESKTLPVRQTLSAVGQAVLMEHYRLAFTKKGVVIAQALLTKRDFKERNSYINTRDSLLTLVKNGIVPIINENDVTAVEEIKFGDNDMLSKTEVANIVDADVLIMLSSVDGLYEHDPVACGEKRLIREVKAINNKILKMIGSSKTKRGFGGMISKIKAVKEAMKGGVVTIIANGRTQDILIRLIEKQEKLGTCFMPAMKKSEYRKKWIISQVLTNATIVVDKRAAEAMLKNKKSLLGVGIKMIKGSFKRGNSVNIEAETGENIACGLVNYDSVEIDRVKGLHSSKIEQVLGINHGEEIVHRDNLVVL